MMKRGPVLPSRRIFAWTSGMILAAISIPGMLVATQKQAVSPLLAIVLPLGSSVVALLIAMGGLELLKRFEKAGWRPSDPRLSNWLLYFGCLGLAGFVIGGVRGAMMIAIKGADASAWQLAAELGLSTYGTLLVGKILDLQSQFEKRALAKREESRQAVSILFESREAWIQARDRRRDELHRILEERVEAELESIHRELESPPGQASLTAEALGALCNRLDRLRDEEIRHLSHLTHPSIIDVGLHPALRSLARRYRNDFEIRLHADAATLESVSAPLRLALYRMVELLLENAAETGVSRAIALMLTREETGIRLEVSGPPGAFDFARARRDGKLAILEARVSLLEGSWEVLDDSKSGIRVLLPPAPRRLSPMDPVG